MTPDLQNVPPPDWQGIGQWAAGIATVLVAIYVSVQRALKTGKEIVSSPPVEHTRIITADTAAMQSLASSMEANTTAMIENNTLHREILGEVREYLKELREDRIEAEIIKKIKQDLAAENSGDRAPRPRRRSEQQP